MSNLGNATEGDVRDFSGLQTDLTERCDGRNTIFGNSVIWENLSEYLHVGDLKSLRLVSRFLCDQVSRSKHFKQNIIVQMKQKMLRDEDFEKFLAKYPKWQSFGFTLFDSRHFGLDEWLLSNYYSAISQSEVKHLTLYWDQGCIRNQNHEGIEASLTFGLLSQTSHINSLEIGKSILHHFKISDADSQIQEVFKKISDFKIFDDIPRRCWSYWHMKVCFVNNLKFLEAVLVRLKRLNFGNTEKTLINEHRRLIFSIIRNNRNTLESLDVRQPEVWSESEIGKIKFPKLNEIAVDCDGHQQSLIKAFLMNQPPLKKINISTDGKLDEEIFAIISEKHSQSLKSLHIKAGWMISNAHQQNISPLSLLKSTTLKDFCLIIPAVGNQGIFGHESFKDIVSHLPSTIEKLKLEGISANSLLNTSEWKFPKLTELSIKFHHLSSAVEKDEFAEKIMTKQECYGKLPFPFLQTLELDGCSVSEERWKDLCELKGLRKLKIVSCGLSNKKVLCLSFTELKYLDISGNRHLCCQAIQQMIKQNPSLESLMCSLYCIQKWGRLSKINDKSKSAYPDSENSDLNEFSSEDSDGYNFSD